MCEFCLKHGEGKKWYLQAENYSEDLLSDARRRRFIEDFFQHPEALAREALDLERLDRAPALIRGLVRRLTTRRMKREHFGQVVPIEEIEEILGFVNTIVRVPCICRHATLGEEKRYCYGVSLSPRGGALARILGGLDHSFLAGPDHRGLERLTREEAVAALRGHEREGLCHTVWTFRTPFICGICNCDRTDCLAMRSTVTHGLPVMFRAEWVARVDPDLCSGCRDCMRVCQFGAIAYSAGTERAAIDPRACYGCGVCRSACTQSAIRLEERAAVPAAAGVW
ncbi:MAG TPA: 4Fe-4S dicluster domain-containing protein [Candidatus Saccharimonadales bacterium]|nr:4Fe-4S dicluster domain-containing protein [Candidatus Saccharimonadales bacterium]